MSEAGGRYLFVFRAALLGPCLRETETAVLVDLAAGSAVLVALPAWGEETGWGSVSATFGPAPDDDPSTGTWSRVEREVADAYSLAEAACREALRPLAAEWEVEAARRRAGAEEELAGFFRMSLEEEVAGLRRVFHQVAVLRVRVTLARRAKTRRRFRRELGRWEGELASRMTDKEDRAASLGAELGRRQRELARRHAARVEVRLVAAARLGSEGAGKRAAADEA